MYIFQTNLQRTSVQDQVIIQQLSDVSISETKHNFREPPETLTCQYYKGPKTIHAAFHSRQGQYKCLVVKEKSSGSSLFSMATEASQSLLSFSDARYLAREIGIEISNQPNAVYIYPCKCNCGCLLRQIGTFMDVENLKNKNR